jgi:UPF0755 protein
VTIDDDVEPIFSGSSEPARPRKARTRLGCLFLVLVLVLIGGGTTYLVSAGWGRIQHKFFYTPPDYQGPGTGKVVIQVKQGNTATEIGKTLYDAGVVASVDAFSRAAAADSRSLGIEVGYYELAKQMSASAALEVLVNPKNLIQDFVTLPEGLRLSQITTSLATQTKISAKRWTKAISQAKLPPEAKGDAEGFLFPATYTMTPGETPGELIAAMVARYNQAANTVGLKQGASALGMSVRDVVIVASIVQKEVRDVKDMPSVAEVIYNRLDGTCSSQGIPPGLLQMDSTVHYAAGVTGQVFTTDKMRNSNSPYNTYKFAGLPPGPISAPGETALTAALNPTHDGWCYFVTVNIATGQTKFAKTLAEHNANVAELTKYCRKSDLC